MVDVPKHSKHGSGIVVQYRDFLRPRFKRQLTTQLLAAHFSLQEIDDVIDCALRLHNRGQSVKQIVAALVAERMAP